MFWARAYRYSCLSAILRGFWGGVTECGLGTLSRTRNRSSGPVVDGWSNVGSCCYRPGGCTEYPRVPPDVSPVEGRAYRAGGGPPTIWSPERDLGKAGDRPG